MSIYGKFLKIANKYPNSPAVKISDNQTISYYGLKKDVDAFIGYIMSELSDEKYIGIVDDQSYLAIVGIAATIFAGKHIVLLDPRSSQEETAELLSKYARFYFSGLHSKLKKLSLIEYTEARNHKERVSKEELADGGGYVIFTSGSTGEPKAVSASSQSLERLAKSLIKKYHIDRSSHVVQFAYFGFDSALAEIWTVLLSGATLLVPGKEFRLNPYQCLRNTLEHNDNIVITLPPSFAKTLDDPTLEHITTLILAGEECPATLANRCRRKVDHLINAYGPTESIICATTYEVDKDQRTRVPLGSPIDGVRIRLSKDGEILISSKQLFDEYLNTKTDNCTKILGRRWFHSGDIGKVSDSGAVEYLGRKDNQIKINGQRIEVEGLEINLREFLGLDDVCIVPGRRNGEPELAVVLTSKSDYERIERTKVLPTYRALPWRLALVDEIPLNLNGKIDRKRLAAKIRDVDNIGCEVLDCSNAINKELLELWQEIFGAPPKSENAGFFVSGGDSLKALRLVKVLNERFGAAIDLTDILRNDYSFADLVELVGEKDGR